MANASNPAHDNEWYANFASTFHISEQSLFTPRPIRLICVGAGPAGLQVAYKAQRLLKDVTVQIYEKGDVVGGTWAVNRYPGCGCDLPSHSYQFSWARNPTWSKYYAPREEIWQYLKDVATKYDLEKYIKFNSKVESATWDEERGVWEVDIVSGDGTHSKDTCEILVNASPKYPDIPGIKEFRGKLMHSATWDASYDLCGKSVAVIGGASSAAQIIPNIQPMVGKLIPFLRSPVWVTPGIAGRLAGPGGANFDYTPEQIEEFSKNPEAYEKYCRSVEAELNTRFPMMHTQGNAQKVMRDAVTNRMAEQLGHDPQMTEKLTPSFPLGCRRVVPSADYLQSLRKPNVQVIAESAVRITEDAVVDSSGHEHKIDVVICATGFDTSFVPQFKVIGRNGEDFKEQFGDCPKAYLSITVHNFPNFFLLIGPNGPASNGALIPIYEWHTRYMFQMIQKLQVENIKAFSPKPEAVQDFYNYTHEMMKRLVWSSPCSSWFKLGKTHGPVTGIWAGSRLHYYEALKNVRYEDYEITYWTGNRFQFLGNGYSQCEVEEDGDVVWYFDDPFVRV